MNMGYSKLGCNNVLLQCTLHCLPIAGSCTSRITLARFYGLKMRVWQKAGPTMWFSISSAKSALAAACSCSHSLKRRFQLLLMFGWNERMTPEFHHCIKLESPAIWISQEFGEKLQCSAEVQQRAKKKSIVPKIKVLDSTRMILDTQQC